MERKAMHFVIIDDNKDALASTKKTLEKLWANLETKKLLPHTITTFHCPNKKNEALLYIENNAKVIDIVFIDYDMPLTNGIGLGKEISLKPYSSIIVTSILSVFREYDKAVEAFSEAGFCYYVDKNDFNSTENIEKTIEKILSLPAVKVKRELREAQIWLPSNEKVFAMTFRLDVIEKILEASLDKGKVLEGTIIVAWRDIIEKFIANLKEQFNDLKVNAEQKLSIVTLKQDREDIEDEIKYYEKLINSKFTVKKALGESMIEDYKPLMETFLVNLKISGEEFSKYAKKRKTREETGNDLSQYCKDNSNILAYVLKKYPEKWKNTKEYYKPVKSRIP